MAVWLFLTGVLLLILLSTFVWKRKWILYHSLKVPGPFSLPFLGTPALGVMENWNDVNSFGKQMMYSKKLHTFKVWAGQQLYIFATRPTDIENVLTNNLSKSNIYQQWDDFSNNSILTSKPALWRIRRKMINPSFNAKIVNSFQDLFVKYSKDVMNILDCEKEIDVSELITKTWKLTLDLTIETLTGVDPKLIEDRHEHVHAVMKYENIAVRRFFKFWLLLDFVWKFSGLYEEAQKAITAGRELTKKILQEAEKSNATRNNICMDDTLKVKRVLPSLLKISNKTGKISREGIYEEIITLLIAGSESTILTINTVLICLGMYPLIQEKVYEEIISVLGPGEKDPSLEDLNRLGYLERVIKETMRIAPTVPFVMRVITDDVKADPYVFPAGSNVVVPIFWMQKDPQLWPNPKEFDPDRFLPEEVKKRHQCAFIPFSFGTRNCIGFSYAYKAMKTQLCLILRQYKVKTLNWKSIDDFEYDLFVLLKPKNCRISLEKRQIQ